MSAKDLRATVEAKTVEPKKTSDHLPDEKTFAPSSDQTPLLAFQSGAQPNAQIQSARLSRRPNSQSPQITNHILQLQRRYGNRTVQRMLGGSALGASFPHAAQDNSLQEASAVAAPEPTADLGSNLDVETPEEAEYALAPPIGSRAELDEPTKSQEETEKLAGEGTNAAAGDRLPTGRGDALPPTMRVRMQTAFGHSFEHVRIHTDSRAATAAAKQKAHAITVGSEISFGSGEFAPHTTSGDQLLAHELTHVVQYDQGRMPSGGVLNPKHELEREAYASEGRIVAALPATDKRLGMRHEPSGGPGKYRGEPALARATDAQVTDRGEWRGPSTTETALMGPLPSAEEARAQILGPSEATPEVPISARPAPSPVAPAQTAEKDRFRGMNAAPTRPERDQAGGRALPPIEADAATGRASPPAPVHKPAPRFRDPSAWTLALTRESSLRIEALRASTATNVQRIRSRAENSVAEARSAFDVARARFESDAQTALAAIDASHGEGARRIDTDMTASEAELDAHFATSSEQVHGTAGDARTRLTEVVEAEANRSVSESEARAAQARKLTQNGNEAEDPPLAEGQREIASRVASEIASWCQQTGQDAAAEVRKAGASHGTGIDAYSDHALETLETARVAADAKLSRSRDETVATLAGQAAEASQEVESRRAEAMAALDQQEQAQYAWIREQSERQCAELSARAEEDIEGFTANFQSLSEGFADAAALAEPFFAAGSAEDPAILSAQNAFNEEISRAWLTYVEPQLVEADRIVASFDEHASGVEEGISRVLSDARAALEQTTAETTTGFTMLGERFGTFVGSAGDSVVAAVRNGVAASCSEADRAVAEHKSAVAAETEQAASAIQSAVDQQLNWEDQQVSRADEQIVAGQAEAAAQYRDLEAQARAMDAGGASAAIARGWLGDLWDWFSDLAESTLEWFQEKLGRVWGNIIGQILRTIIYVVGVVACGFAWVGAQIINLAWGFIWGETLIPGYGGEVFALIADIIAGVLVYGDIRDLFKYGIWRPFITGEGPWWLNLTMIVVTVIGLFPLFGDIFKGVVKIIKSGGKGTIKALYKLLGKELAERILRRLGIEIGEEVVDRLARDVGQELAARMVRELGAEAAEALLEKLGKEALQKLAQELSPTAINKLLGELGERTLKRLAETLGGKAIETITADLGREAIEKLLRTVTAEVVEELHRRLGKDALLNLLQGLRGVTVKEYLDELGEVALRNLGRELDGYAVKELFDSLGATTLRELTEELGARALKTLWDELGEHVFKDLVEKVGARGVKELNEEFGAAGVKELTEAFTTEVIRDLLKEFGARGLKEAWDTLGKTALSDLVREFGAAGFKNAWEQIGKDGMKVLTADLAAPVIKRLYDDLGGLALKNLTDGLTGNQLFDLARNHGIDISYFKSLGEVAGSGKALARALTHFGSAADLAKVLNKAHSSTMSAGVLKEFLEKAVSNNFKKISEIEKFFDYVVTHGVSDAAFRSAMEGGEIFAKESVGNTVTYAGRVVPDAVAPVKRVLDLADGSKVTVTLNNDDILHMASRHTWEFFAMVMGNVKPRNTMWPSGTTRADVLNMATDALNSAEIEALVKTLTSGMNQVVEVTVNGLKHEVRIALNGPNGLVSMYPLAGQAGVLEMPKNLMKAAISLWKSI